VTQNIPVIGITGGIGAGKSTVARILGQLGALVIDSDAVAHDELRSPEVVEAIRTMWGSEVCPPGGEINRALLGQKVFADPIELRKLEDLLYPRINRRRREIIAEEASQNGVRVVVLDAPKLYEAGVDKECDAVIFVDADEDVRLWRVSQSRGWSPAELARREKMQIPLDKKRAMADYVVVNNHTGVDSLTPELKRILESVVGSKSKQKP
jgi:dephospho-CoA kinase